MKSCTVYRLSPDRGKVKDRCDRCGGEIYRGETHWHFHGRTVCRDCFTPFARELLSSYECPAGEEEEG